MKRSALKDLNTLQGRLPKYEFRAIAEVPGEPYPAGRESRRVMADIGFDKRIAALSALSKTERARLARSGAPTII